MQPCMARVFNVIVKMVSRKTINNKLAVEMVNPAPLIGSDATATAETRRDQQRQE